MRVRVKRLSCCFGGAAVEPPSPVEEEEDIAGIGAVGSTVQQADFAELPVQESVCCHLPPSYSECMAMPDVNDMAFDAVSYGAGSEYIKYHCFFYIQRTFGPIKHIRVTNPKEGLFHVYIKFVYTCNSERFGRKHAVSFSKVRQSDVWSYHYDHMYTVFYNISTFR